jgi:hypothetical protein
MFCRFVTQNGLANNQTNRRAIILEVRKVLDGTYTSMSSLDTDYFDRSASVLVGGGTGGLGAIKAADGATSLYQNIASADSNESITFDKYHYDYKSGFQPKRHIKYSFLNEGIMRTVVNSSNTSSTYEAFGQNWTSGYNGTTSTSYTTGARSDTLRAIEIFASKYWFIWTWLSDVTTAQLSSTHQGFFDFESDKQQEYCYTHSTWAGGQSTYPGFSWIVHNNRANSNRLDTADLFILGMVGYAQADNQGTTRGIQREGYLNYDLAGSRHYGFQPATNGIEAIFITPPYPNKVYPANNSDTSILTRPLLQVMVHGYEYQTSTTSGTNYPPAAHAKIPFLYRTSDYADYQGSPVTVGSDTYRIIRMHKTGYASAAYSTSNDNDNGSLACYALPQTIGGV